MNDEVIFDVGKFIVEQVTENRIESLLFYPKREEKYPTIRGFFRIMIKIVASWYNYCYL